MRRSGSAQAPRIVRDEDKGEVLKALRGTSNWNILPLEEMVSIASSDTVNGQPVIVLPEAVYGDLTMSVSRLCADYYRPFALHQLCNRGDLDEFKSNPKPR